MKDFTVKDILLSAGGELISGSPETPVLSMTTDSREAKPGALFVPIIGEKLDGHRYLGEAVRRGCAAVLSSSMDAIRDVPGIKEKTAVILVPDTVHAVQAIAREARLRLSYPAVGVTGSVGKTTTREMIACALSSELRVYRTGKNYNNWLGVPITLCAMPDDCDIAVLELGLNVRGELGLISSLTNIDTAVITNIGLAHIEYYGTQDELAKEKFTITRGFFPENPAEKFLILNSDDPYLMKYRDLTGFPVRTFGLGEDADYRASGIRKEGGHFVFDFYRLGRFLFPVRLSVPGAHNVRNALAALAVADRYGVDLRKAADSLNLFTGFENRLQRFDQHGYTIIDDTYNASPDSMKAGLTVLTELQPGKPGGRRIAVLGDMFELGDRAPEYHYDVGAFGAALPVDLWYLAGENARQIGKGLKNGNPEASVILFGSVSELTEALLREVREGDLIYLKASHGMQLHNVTEVLLK